MFATGTTSFCTAPGCKNTDTNNVLFHLHDGEYGVTGVVILLPRDKWCTIPGCGHYRTHTNEDHKCRVCDDEFESKEKLKPDDRYCGYCEAVHKGEPDAKWLPSVDREEIDRKGVHKL